MRLGDIRTNEGKRSWLPSWIRAAALRRRLLTDPNPTRYISPWARRCVTGTTGVQRASRRRFSDVPCAERAERRGLTARYTCTEHIRLFTQTGRVFRSGLAPTYIAAVCSSANMRRHALTTADQKRFSGLASRRQETHPSRKRRNLRRLSRPARTDKSRASPPPTRPSVCPNPRAVRNRAKTQ